MRQITILLLAIGQAIYALGTFPDAKDVEWVERDDFTGISFTVYGLPCDAGVFGDDPDLPAVACDGDPWALRP